MTELTYNNDINQLIDDYKRINEELNRKLQEHGTTFFVSLFQKLFDENPGLNKMAVLGWTPGFNDGEPCTHSSNVYVGITYTYSSGTYADYSDYDELVEFFEEDIDENGEAKEAINPNLECETLRQVKQILDSFEDIFERVYHTNFIIKVTRDEDGSACVDVDDYDCGH